MRSPRPGCTHSLGTVCQQMLDEGSISDVRLYTDAPYAQAEGLEVDGFYELMI